MRAMTFETQVRSQQFVSELVTKTVGQLGLERPSGVRRGDCRGTPAQTATEFGQAHLAALYRGEATLLSQLAVPFYGLEERDAATSVLPDFAVVCTRCGESGMPVGSWLVMGDAKDYERVRARIDDGRMLKGFLQVALGAESAAAWTRLPDGMEVHQFGVLAVPQNAFLRPEAVVEDLSDHRKEVRASAQRRIDTLTTPPKVSDLHAIVHGLEAAFDPASCVSCSLQGLCRSELRASTDPTDVLVEIGVEAPARQGLRPVVGGGPPGAGAKPSRVAQVQATVSGAAVWQPRGRVDPIGQPGTVAVAIAKSDGGAVALHGIAVQAYLDKPDPEPWRLRIFDQPMVATTRTGALALVGDALRQVIDTAGLPVHLVVPDHVTADVLVSIADSVAGVELSRLRWHRDIEMGREPVTFDGEPATVPPPLSDSARLAVSFLLEEDRARAMSSRHPVVDARAVLASHMTAGGPVADSGRLDYLLEWAEATAPLDHRAVSDRIADELHTPGARLTNRMSDQIHRAAGDDRDVVIEEELRYKTEVLDRARAVLGGLSTSPLCGVHRALEESAQQVWWRRYSLQASDLVRFSRTNQRWRNAQVDLLDRDRAAVAQLSALGDPNAAADMAVDAGARDLALARVVGLNPVRLVVASRRLSDGATAVALHRNGAPLVDAPGVDVTVQAGSFKFRGMHLGPLVRDEDDPTGWLTWSPRVPLELTVGDELVIADVGWFGRQFVSGHEIAVNRPAVDDQSAPRPTCTSGTYAADPDGHRWCCRPHAVSEAEWSDEIAARRSRGEMNPQVWPPLVDEERFDVAGTEPEAPATDGPPPDLGIDDVN